MTSYDPTDSIRRAWQADDESVAFPTLDDVRRRARWARYRFARRNLREYVAGAVLVPLVVADLVRGEFNVLRDTGDVLLLLGIAYVLVRLYRHGNTAAIPERLGLMDGVSFYRWELARQRELLATVWRWYLSPLLPGMLLTLVGRAVETPTLWAHLGRGVVGLLALMAFVHWLNRRAASRLQRTIERLDAIADGASVGLPAPELPPLVERLSTWAMLALATASLPFAIVNAFGARFVPAGATPTPRYLGVFWAAAVVVFVGQVVWWVVRKGQDRGR